MAECSWNLQSASAVIKAEAEMKFEIRTACQGQSYLEVR